MRWAGPLLIAWFCAAPGLSASPEESVSVRLHESQPARQPPVELCPGQPLSLADLESLAQRCNPTLVQAAATVRANWAEAYQSARYPNPRIGYLASLIGISGTAGSPQAGFFSQTIVVPGKLRLNYAKNAQEAVRAEWEEVAQAWRVINSVRIHYYRLLMLQELVALRQRRLRNAARWLQTMQELQDELKSAAQVDIILATANLQQARIDLEAEATRQRQAWIELASIVGTPQLSPAPLEGPLAPDGPVLEWAPCLERLLACSPELKAAEAQVAHYQYSVEREKLECVPDLDAWTAAGYDYPSQRAVASVQLGIEVPLWDRNRGAIDRAAANIVRARADTQRVALSLQQRLAAVFQEYQLAQRTAAILRDTSVPRLTESAQPLKEKNVAMNELIHAERLLFGLEEEYITSLFRVREAEIKITGLLLVDGLSLQ